MRVRVRVVRPRHLLTGLILLGLALLFAGCDGIAQYTLINETQESLITRAVFEKCGLRNGNQSDYLSEQTVPPATPYQYEDIFGGAFTETISCVQVMAPDRRMVLQEPYKENGTYTVSDPLQPLGQPLPDVSQLPRQSGLEQIAEKMRDEPLQGSVEIAVVLVVPLAFLAAFIAGFVYTAVITIRFFYQRYVGKR